MLNSLEAWPKRESVTVLAHTSDHSVKAFMPTLLVLHQRLILYNEFLTALTAHITPVIPDEPDLMAAILYYNSIGFMDTATIIALIGEYARDLPPPAAVA
jgi:hypothetical protein